MAFLDYGAILKVNGEIKNLNKGLFMDMKESVGFVINSIPTQYEWDGKTHDSEHHIDGNYFVYFGDEEVLFCIYKNVLQIVVNKKIIHHVAFSYDKEYKQVLVEQFENTPSMRVKRICGSDKLHLKVQYKGINYEVIYGYGIENNLNTYNSINKKERGYYCYNKGKQIHVEKVGGYKYGYNAAIKRYIDKFLNLKTG